MQGKTRFLDRIVAGTINIRCGDEDLPAHRWAGDPIRQPSLGFSDAAVVACAECTGGQVLTFDRRDFDVLAREGTITLV